MKVGDKITVKGIEYEVTKITIAYIRDEIKPMAMIRREGAKRSIRHYL